MPLYFAYGSNMSTRRLRARVPSAAPYGTGCVRGCTLRFHKRSTDGSGKADAYSAGIADDVVWGVLFELSDSGLAALDRVEGDGYARVRATVTTSSGEFAEAWTYTARSHALDESLLPLAKYLAHLLMGAREHGLPGDYIAALERTPTQSEGEHPAPEGSGH